MNIFTGHDRPINEILTLDLEDKLITNRMFARIMEVQAPTSNAGCPNDRLQRIDQISTGIQTLCYPAYQNKGTRIATYQRLEEKRLERSR